MGLTSHSIANIMPCEIPLEGKKLMRLQKDFDPTVVSESLPVNNGRYRISANSCRDNYSFFEA